MKRQIPISIVKDGLLIALLGAVLVSGCGRTASHASKSTLVVPTVTPPPTTATATPTLALESANSISEIRRLNASNGWAWSNGVEGHRLLHTTNGGLTWRDVTPRAYPYIEGGSCFLDSQTAWVSTLDRQTYAGGLLRTTDGGESWSVLIKPGAAPYGCLTSDGSYCHFFNTTDGLARTGDFGAGTVYYRYFETHDGGMSWTPVPIISPYPDNHLPPGTIHLCNICGGGISYYPPTKVIITDGDLAYEQPQGAVRLSLSTNLGKSWRELRLPVPEKYRDGLSDPLLPVFFDGKNGLLPVHILKWNTDTSHAYTYAYSVLVFYATDDGGSTWTARPGIVEFTSDGQQWSFGSPLDVVSLKDVFVRGGPNLYVSRDGARSWRTIKPNIDFGLEGSKWDVSRMDFVDATHGWIVFSDNRSFAPYGKYSLYRTSDGGATWMELPLRIVP